jgi:hypothetical protein
MTSLTTGGKSRTGPARTLRMRGENASIGMRRRRRKRPPDGAAGFAAAAIAGACYFPAVLKRERSQLDSAYRVRRIPSRSSTTVGWQRACQAARPSASAFSSSGVRDRAARTTPPRPMLKSVDWLGVRGVPLAMAVARLAAAAAAARDAAAASAACPWSIENDDWADAVETAAARMRNTPAIMRMLNTPLGVATPLKAGVVAQPLAIGKVLRSRETG